jgi:UDP-3-O-[3-hydroxymyristoyl] glucosamine N-acyltransferase
MSIKLVDIAKWIQSESGIDVEIQGDAQLEISKISTLENATQRDIAFLANKKYRNQLEECQASAVIIEPSERENWHGDALIMQNPYVGFALTAQMLDTTPQQQVDISPSATISPTAQLGINISIGANSVIESGAVIEDNVQIGAGCVVGQGTIVGAGTRLWSNVTLYHGVKIGQRCGIHSNTVIGSDGFGYAPLKKNGTQTWIKIPQLGNVVIGHDCQIGASTTIDRGAIDDTVIGNGVILDNQIQIAHNVSIGDGTAIAAGCLIAGSTSIGANVTIGGGCGITGHINIVDNAFITAYTFVINDIKEAGVYSSGMPAQTNKEWRNNTARYRKLTELFSRVKTLENAAK